MKFSLAVACLASGAHCLVAGVPPTPVERSATLVDRDLKTAQSVLADVKNGFDSLAAAAEAFNGDVTPLKNTATTFINKVNSDTTVVQKMTALSTIDCFSLISPAQDAQKEGQTLADDLVAKKSAVEAAKQCETVYNFLGQGATAAQGLIKAVVAKVPSGLQGTVQSEGDGITKTLTDTQAQFAKGNCTDAA